MKHWRFFGDRWLSKTSHLSLIREGAYVRLMSWCMTHECPLPPNLKDCLKIARVTTRHEIAAALSVIGEFFELREDGYHQTTIDEQIDYWQTTGKDRADKQVFLSRTRGEAFRQRQRETVQALRDKGVAVDYRASVSELARLCHEHGVTQQTLQQTSPVANSKRYSNYTANAQPVIRTANAFAPDGANAFATPADERPGPLSRALRAMEKAGLEGVHPGSTHFVELVTRGAQPGLFRLAAVEAVAKGKGYAWAMAMALGRLNDGVIDLDGNAIRKPRNGAPAAFQGPANGLVPTEAREALKTRLNDPTANRWELPDEPAPSPSESDVPY